MASVVRKHPLLGYILMCFGLSWGALFLVLGFDGFIGRTPPNQDQLPLLFAAILLGPALAGPALAALVDGSAGLRELRRRLFKWRVAPRFYALAMLFPLFVTATVLLLLSLASSRFTPGVMSTPDRLGLVMSGVLGGLAAGFFEEIGWTGFVVPELRRRSGVLRTGLVVGLLWGAWHYPLFSAGDPWDRLPAILFVPVLLFTHLPAFRVYMVWLFEQTGSSLLVVLMHMGLTASVMTLQPADLGGTPAVVFNLTLAAVLWTIVGLCGMYRWSQRRPSETRTGVPKTGRAVPN